MTAKRKAAESVVLQLFRLRHKEGKAVELVEQLLGVSGINDFDLAHHIDSCATDGAKPSPAQIADVVTRIKRGEFSIGDARRMRGNGNSPPP